jgi:hypothetical protein
MAASAVPVRTRLINALDRTSSIWHHQPDDSPELERDMATTTKFEGFSRKSYDYARADLTKLNELSTQGGCYLFAARVGGSPVIVYAAETGSIRATVANDPLWAEARDKHGAIFIFIHLNPNPALRRLEVHDLIRKHNPPMNPRSTVQVT